MPNFHTLKRYSHRNAPKKLIPAIIACKCVTYLSVFGFLIILCGFIPLLISEPIDNEFVNSTESINQTLTTTVFGFNETISDPNDRWFNQNTNTIFYSCLGIGSLLLVSAIVCLLIAYYYFKTYEEERIRHIQITDLDDTTHSIITDPIIDGVGYPISLMKKCKPNEYLPISQSNNVYKSTTEPLK